MFRNTVVTLSKYSLLLAVCCLTLWAKPALASPVTWTLSGVTFSGGGTASGSFVFNATTDTFSSIDITVAGSAFGDGTYTALDPGFTSSEFLLLAVPSTSVNLTGTPLLVLNFSTALTNAGGTVSLFNISGINQCLNYFCSSSSLVDGFTAGVVSSSVSATPEPSSLLLLGTGLLGFGPFFRRFAH